MIDYQMATTVSLAIKLKPKVDFFFNFNNASLNGLDIHNANEF